MTRLSHDFYQQQALTVARQVLGGILVHHLPEGITAGRIVETEAYGGCPEDTACHAWKGRTERTAVMFGSGGRAYVYLIYGMYYCFNIVTGQEGDGQAVLIRAVEPLEGIDLMMQRRKTAKLTNLCSGPGKLCQAFAITRQHNGLDLAESVLYIKEGQPVPDDQVAATPRVNVDYAGEARHFPWRFVVKASPFLSK